MLHKLKEKDFAVLRGPLESGRQSPDSLAGALFLLIFLQALIYYVTYYIAAEVQFFQTWTNRNDSFMGNCLLSLPMCHLFTSNDL